MTKAVIDLRNVPIKVKGFAGGGGDHTDKAEFHFHIHNEKGECIGTIRVSPESWAELVTRAHEIMGFHAEATRALFPRKEE